MVDVGMGGFLLRNIHVSDIVVFNMEVVQEEIRRCLVVDKDERMLQDWFC